ncbi:MAG: Gfo/Idh/MocA family oxidoreductase [Lachnospiraceae bacterium]|nr:Gfo/Idh/MocA family oxidoreductase [Lachnospiraceae bacterium]
MNVGIIGAGNIAGVMAKTLKGMKHVNRYAVAARDLERAEVFAKEYGMKKAYGSYEELVQDEKVDLVYISTPHSHHFEHAMLCIDHGKPVLCEKAFCANAAQAEELFRYARGKGVFITEAIWTRYMPFLKTMRDVLESGVIGEPKMLSANLSYQIDHVERMQEPALAGGSLLDVGVYTLHFAAMMFGKDVKTISSVCTYTEKGMDEQDSVTLIFEDGKMAVLNCSMLAIGDRKGMIHGTKGYAVIENINNFESMTVFDSNHKKIAFYKRPKQISGYEYEVEASLEAVRKGWLEYPDIPHEETLRIMRQMDEIRGQLGVRYPFENSEGV